MALLRALTSIAHTPRTTGGCFAPGASGVATRDEMLEPDVAEVVGLAGDSGPAPLTTALGAGERTGVAMMLEVF